MSKQQYAHQLQTADINATGITTTTAVNTVMALLIGFQEPADALGRSGAKQVIVEDYVTIFLEHNIKHAEIATWELKQELVIIALVELALGMPGAPARAEVYALLVLLTPQIAKAAAEHNLELALQAAPGLALMEPAH